MLRLACNKNKEKEKACALWGLADNKDTDQHAHSRTDMDLCCLLQ